MPNIECLQVVTFTPLSRGRFRANGHTNKSGKPVILKRNQLEAFRQNRFNQLHPRPAQQKRKSKVLVRRVEVDRYESWFVCPVCSLDHKLFTDNDQFRCSCGTELIVVRKSRWY